MSTLIRMSNASGRGVLIIEDMSECESLIRTIIVRAGLAREEDIRLAETLAEARAQLARGIPRAVVADYSLPDGVITRLVSLHHEHVGLVVQTAFDNIRIPANLTSIVAKPVTRALRGPFIDALRAALERPLRPEFTPSEIFFRLNHVTSYKTARPAMAAMGHTGYENLALADAGQVDIETARKVMAEDYRATGTTGRHAPRAWSS